MKDEVEKSLNSSRCTECVQRQTNKQTYNFSLVGFLGLPLLVMKGPSKSIIVSLNGSEGLTLASDNCPIICEAVRRYFFWQGMQCWDMAITRCLAPTTK